MNPPTPEDPKGIAGLAKPQLQLVPPVINTAMAAALKIGADKYGPWNWRTNRVEIMTYLGAMRRHIDAVLEGEDLDPESGTHHLGHVAAGCAIVLDARAHGTLVDNRPPAHNPLGESARLSREVLDNIEANLKKASAFYYRSEDGGQTYEVALNPNDDLAEYLAARQRMRDAMTPEEKELRKEVREASTLPPMDTSVEEAKKLIWGELFAQALPYEKGLIPPRMMDAPSRPILIADEQAPTNLDAIANHIDQVVNEFPTEPLDPHA